MDVTVGNGYWKLTDFFDLINRLKTFWCYNIQKLPGIFQERELTNTNVDGLLNIKLFKTV